MNSKTLEHCRAIMGSDDLGEAVELLVKSVTRRYKEMGLGLTECENSLKAIHKLNASSGRNRRHAISCLSDIDNLIYKKQGEKTEK